MNVRIYKNAKEQFCFYVSNSATDRFRVPSTITNQVDAESTKVKLETLLPLSKKQVEQIINGGTVRNSNKNLFSVIIENFIRKTDLEAGWSYSTLKHFNGLKKKINNHWEGLYVEDMCNEDWLYSYVAYRQITAINTTVAKEIKSIKQFFRYVDRIGLCDCSSVVNTKVRLKKASKPNVIYLTKNEIKKLRDFEFDKEYLSRVRDLFLFACNTGLRYSDTQNLSKSNVINNCIVFTTKKTDDTLCVPLTPFAMGILVKYNYTLPKMTDQVANRFLKEACRAAGITEPVTKVSYRGSSRVEDTKMKCELISFHSGRKSFISNSLIAGIPATTVMTMSGHKTYQAMLPYISISDDAKKDAINNLSSFLC